ncbi:hypothetical protein [Vibrio sp. 10N.239.312.D08]|uniref:hypothetical protein n=1 Tax=Vibrio sp. 10N.239.312.D08 TaxID=3229978 RepID=UPI003554309A
MTKRFVIKSGTITGFADDMEKLNPNVESFKQKRVSVILPVNPLLRVVFKKVRAHVSDSSWVASASRLMPCKWVAVIDGLEHGPFSSRLKAIEFEKDHIYSQGKLNMDIDDIGEVSHV